MRPPNFSSDPQGAVGGGSSWRPLRMHKFWRENVQGASGGAGAFWRQRWVPMQHGRGDDAQGAARLPQRAQHSQQAKHAPGLSLLGVSIGQKNFLLGIQASLQREFQMF
jgi:hypothetical protein